MDASVDVPTTPSPLSPAEMATFTSIATNSRILHGQYHRVDIFLESLEVVHSLLDI